nr:mitogen-activated protein kinase kinase kinase NPK1-like [Ipomoea batatas]
MATGRPPWSQQYQEVAALFHIGTTKSHPPIPEHLSPEAKDFLLKCLQKEPNLRPTASDLLQNNSGNKMAGQKMDVKKS